MANIVQVTMGREGHYRVVRLAYDTSATLLGRCECDAIWDCALNETYDSFTDWMMYHDKPTVVRVDVRCAGTHALIDRDCCDKDWVGWCPVCQLYRPTSPQEGYDDRYRQFDPHPIWTAVTP